MSIPEFGILFNHNTTEPTPILPYDFSKTLLIETSEDASPTTFPVDTPVRFSTGDPSFLDALGTGPLRDAVKGVSDQLTDLNNAADVTVVRVAEGADDLATAANIVNITDSLTDIPHAVNSIPRIVVAGRTNFLGSGGAANPVTASLEANLGKILAIAPVDIDDTSLAASLAQRATLASERIMPIGVRARVYEGESLVTRSMASRVAGLIARVDRQAGQGRPFEPFANRNLFGIAGVTRPVPFSFIDGSAEGQALLGGNVAIVAQGEPTPLGATAGGDGGFVFIGADSASSDPLLEQIHQVRAADYIVAEILLATRGFLGRKITADVTAAWLNSIYYLLRDHKTNNRILGHNERTDMFRPDRNTPETIRAGTLRIDLAVEPAPVFKRVEVDIRRYRPALNVLVDDILSNFAASA